MFAKRFFLCLLPLVVVGCSSHTSEQLAQRPISRDNSDVSLVSPVYQRMYGEITTDKYPIMAADLTELDSRYFRQQVSYNSKERPGTIIIDTGSRFLYLVQENGKAMRYGIGVGKEGLTFKGRAVIQRKAEWPSWTPTAAMIKREPERNKKWAGGMKGGPENPLGARALYLYRDGKDTMFRIHGTNEPWSIGQSVSSGCIRLMNQDIIDLYNRTPSGTKVVVKNDSFFGSGEKDSDYAYNGGVLP